MLRSIINWNFTVSDNAEHNELRWKIIYIEYFCNFMNRFFVSYSFHFYFSTLFKGKESEINKKMDRCKSCLFIFENNSKQ